MNWEALGAIGEIGGAIAVIATLGYLAVQIRQNTETVRLVALDSQQQYGVNLRGQIIENADVARIWRLGLQDYSSLGEDDQVRFRFLMYNMLFSHEFRFDHRRHGLIEPEFRERDDELLRFYFAQPGVRQWWEIAKVRFTRSFVGHVAQLMQRENIS